MNPANNHLMVCLAIQTIQDEKQRELELQQAAERDSLTGLLNRNYARRKVENYIAGHNKPGSGYLFIIDIDNFKGVNNTYGHRTGDEVLKTVASIIHGAFRASNVTCRLGGDEFMVFMTQQRKGFSAEARARKVLADVKFQCRTQLNIDVIVSIGICSYPEDGSSVPILYANADEALYHSKNPGKDRFSIYQPQE